MVDFDECFSCFGGWLGAFVEVYGIWCEGIGEEGLDCCIMVLSLLLYETFEVNVVGHIAHFMFM